MTRCICAVVLPLLLVSSHAIAQVEARSSASKPPPLSQAVVKANNQIRNNADADRAEIAKAFDGVFYVLASVQEQEPIDGAANRYVATISVDRNLKYSVASARDEIAAANFQIRSAEQAVNLAQQKAERDLGAFDKTWKRRWLPRQKIHKWYHGGCQIRNPPISDQAGISRRNSVIDAGRRSIQAAASNVDQCKQGLRATKRRIDQLRRAAVQEAESVRLNIAFQGETPDFAGMAKDARIPLQVTVVDYETATDAADFENPSLHVTSIELSAVVWNAKVPKGIALAEPNHQADSASD